MATFQIGLFDCFQDLMTCLLGCFVPCYLTAVNLARVDGRECSICDCLVQCNPNWVVRTRIRTKYGLQYQHCMDCLISSLCFTSPCAACQHANEMTAREKGGSTTVVAVAN